MKKIFLLLALALLATPNVVRAHDNDERNEDHDRDDRDHGHDRDDTHPKVKAGEMIGIGIAGASLLGVVGYFILRKRNALV